MRGQQELELAVVSGSLSGSEHCSVWSLTLQHMTTSGCWVVGEDVTSHLSPHFHGLKLAVIPVVLESFSGAEYCCVWSLTLQHMTTSGSCWVVGEDVTSHLSHCFHGLELAVISVVLESFYGADYCCVWFLTVAEILSYFLHQLCRNVHFCYDGVIA